MQPGAPALSGSRQAAAVLHRMQREALVVQQPAVRLPAHQEVPLQFGLSQELGFDAEQVSQLVLALRHLGHAVRTVSELEPAVRGAFDIQILGLDDLPDRADRLAPLLEDALGSIEAEAGDPIGEIILADTDGAEAAVAAAAAPSDAVRFQHMGGNAVVPGQVIGGRQPGVAGADNGDVHIHVGGDGIAAFDLGPGRRRPVGLDMARPWSGQVGWIDGHEMHPGTAGQRYASSAAPPPAAGRRPRPLAKTGCIAPAAFVAAAACP